MKNHSPTGCRPLSISSSSSSPSSIINHQWSITNNQSSIIIHQSINQSINQSIKQSINQSSNHQSINQSISQTINQSISSSSSIINHQSSTINHQSSTINHQSINQSIKSLNQSINQASKQASIQSINQSINQSSPSLSSSSSSLLSAAPSTAPSCDPWDSTLWFRKMVSPSSSAHNAKPEWRFEHKLLEPWNLCREPPKRKTCSTNPQLKTKGSAVNRHQTRKENWNCSRSFFGPLEYGWHSMSFFVVNHSS